MSGSQKPQPETLRDKKGHVSPWYPNHSQPYLFNLSPAGTWTRDDAMNLLTIQPRVRGCLLLRPTLSTWQSENSPRKSDSDFQVMTDEWWVVRGVVVVVVVVQKEVERWVLQSDILPHVLHDTKDDDPPKTSLET